MSKKSAKKRQPVKPVVAKEPARTAKNFGYEEMLSELEAIVADAETRLAEDEAPARTAKNFGYEEMLSELEAIVADAETRLAEDEATA